MSGQSVSIPQSEEKWYGQEFEQPTEVEVADQPDDEQPEHDEPPAQSQDIPPGQEVEDERVDASQECDLEDELQELTQPETWGEGGDGPDIEGDIVTYLEPVKMPEPGEGQP
ncbi:P antigen family member 3-like [Tamandua tetradactyla]|uniref:P antigen family member 3-like n=1 Tax=Tamandua tetradactyla TaxID=48850 RepID=UPI004053F466